ncbi:MAG: DUF808 family protein [Desulfopila sp.]
MTGGIFAVLDDIALLLDDAAVLSKIAAKKTAGILGDDLAVNAERATGFQASRELPVLWAIAKGAVINKLIILPLAFLLSAWAPWAIVPILLVGGVYLSYEGVEKIYHCCRHAPETERPAAESVADAQELLRREAVKVKSAIRTDFILSIEIVIVALGAVMGQQLALQVMVVTVVALLATVGVYGLVACIVRMDDVGFFLIQLGRRSVWRIGGSLVWLGAGLVAALPWVVRSLAVIGTVAMLLVGGGMFTHNVHLLHEATAGWPPLLAELVIALVVGGAALALHLAVTLVRQRNSA